MRCWCAAWVLLVMALPLRAQGPPLARFDDSRLQGSLGAPLPYEAVRVFPELDFRNPVEIVPEPGSEAIYVSEVNGVIYRFDPAAPAVAPQRVVDLRAELPEVNQLYGMACHPQFQKNGLVYLCYVLRGTAPDGTRLVECQIDCETGRLDVAGRRLLLTWLGGGHNGSSLQFGPDGFLYISAGDGTGPNPPDRLLAGQDCQNFLSSVLRIDVDRRDPGRPYAIPPDNPFADTAEGLPEIWAYGFRNPWRMSFDRKTGELWLGDVGWDTWELIYYVQRGGNYGWSVMEGRQPIHVSGQRGPTPIDPPTVEHPHSEARSITGGYVYWGERLPALKGAYVYGDYETGKIWALWHDRGERLDVQEIADTELRIICFGQTHDGEIYVVDYAGGIYELRPRRAETAEVDGSVPGRLSETGLFQEVAAQVPAPGLQPYGIEHPMWSDGLRAQRWLALPEGRMQMDRQRATLPERALLVKTLSRPVDGKPVETQILQKREGLWRAWSYAWNADHSDAVLVPEYGAKVGVPDAEAGSHTWRLVSRSECLVCHNAHVGGVLGVSPWQWSEGTQEVLGEMGWLRQAGRRGRDRSERSDPHAARTYLDVNCASCHRQNGGGLVPMELARDLPEARLHAVDVVPQRGTFGISEARIIAPGRPERSTLLYRMAAHGSGRMPHLGSSRVDAEGFRLVYDWIEGLGSEARRDPVAEEAVPRALRALRQEGPSAPGLQALEGDPFVAALRLPSPGGEALETMPEGSLEEGDGKAVLRLKGEEARGQALLQGARGALCLTCHEIGGRGKPFGPSFDGIGARRSPEQLLESILNPSREIATRFVHYTVALRDGPSLSGLVVHHDRNHLVLRDAALEERAIPVERIATMTASDQSVMPAGLAHAFSSQELADLLAYLQSLR